jgi:hypothetical protein
MRIDIFNLKLKHNTLTLQAWQYQRTLILRKVTMNRCHLHTKMITAC